MIKNIKKTKKKNIRTSGRLRKKIKKRLANTHEVRDNPMMDANNIRYELSEKTEATVCGGIGIIHKMNTILGVPELINSKLHLFKIHKPYFESDHILNMCYNIISGGNCIEDLEVRRTDASYMNGLGAKRVPDPTTAGDFLRRFDSESKIEILQEINSELIERVFRLAFNNQKQEVAYLDIDGSLVTSYGEYKEELNYTYKKTWGFSTLVLTEATTGVHLYVLNRGGNIVSQEDAEKWLDASIQDLKKYFKKIIIRGDSAYYLTHLFDKYTSEGVEFIISVDHFSNLIKTADKIDEDDWIVVPHTENTGERNHGKENVKEEVIKEKGFMYVKQIEERTSEFEYTPTNCEKSYRIIAVRQLKETLSEGLFKYYQFTYYFYITNKQNMNPIELLSIARGRCNHENKIEQLKNGVCAMKMPAKEFHANQAYMIICSMAWNTKCYIGLFMPNKELGDKIIRMEFKKFKLYCINIPCQIVNTGRYIVYKLLAYNNYIIYLLKTFDKLCSLKV